MSRMIFVTGFARGGTTWLRNCIASHPDVSKINRELVLFREHGRDRDAMARAVQQAVDELDLDGPHFVEKSPANAPHIADAARTLPEAKFLFIIRDPRDVFISHKRGTKAWMGGANSTISGCLEKSRKYYEGYLEAIALPNVMLVRYEDLHQDFHATMKRAFTFTGLAADDVVIEQCFRENDFWNVATRHIERRDEARRKGVVGDWVNFLEPKEAAWLKENGWWTDFMARYGYEWEPVTYMRILDAMHHAGVRAIDEHALLTADVDADAVNLLLCHDVDNLRSKFSRDSILTLARHEASLGYAAMYFFLPLDDVRYAGLKPNRIVDFITELRDLNPHLSVGLHLNAAERFFPAAMDDAGNDHPDISKAVACLHDQIDAYESYGISFRTATAHGYGRRKKLPNNRDTPIFTDELASRRIALWDTALRKPLFRNAAHVAHFADVGGAISARQVPCAGAITDASTYGHFPAGSLIHFLIHPGNFDVSMPIALGRRFNAAKPASRETVSA